MTPETPQMWAIDVMRDAPAAKIREALHDLMSHADDGPIRLHHREYYSVQFDDWRMWYRIALDTAPK